MLKPFGNQDRQSWKKVLCTVCLVSRLDFNGQDFNDLASVLSSGHPIQFNYMSRRGIFLRVTRCKRNLSIRLTSSSTSVRSLPNFDSMDDGCLDLGAVPACRSIWTIQRAKSHEDSWTSWTSLGSSPSTQLRPVSKKFDIGRPEVTQAHFTNACQSRLNYYIDRPAIDTWSQCSGSSLE